MATFTNRDGIRLFFRDWGDGAPLVFVHGGALNADCWEYQTVPLAEQGFRCIAADTRGCGRSEEPWSGYGYDDLADDLADLLDHLAVDGVTLVGHSMGAGTITRYLTRHGSERVGRAVLVAPITPFMVQTDDNPAGVPAAVFDESVALLRADRPRWIELAAPAFFGGDPGEEDTRALVEWGKGLALGSGAKATLELFGGFHTTDFRSELGAFTMPTLVVHGDADMTAPLELCGKQTAAGIADARLEIYPGGSHGIFLTHAARLNADIAAFVAA
jgi:pimeloyl-ACP methyl ester carboxylesterase